MVCKRVCRYRLQGRHSDLSEACQKVSKQSRSISRQTFADGNSRTLDDSMAGYRRWPVKYGTQRQRTQTTFTAREQP